MVRNILSQVLFQVNACKRTKIAQTLALGIEIVTQLPRTQYLSGSPSSKFVVLEMSGETKTVVDWLGCCKFRAIIKTTIPRPWPSGPANHLLA
jgi:hypothetical protein